jgi:acetyl esterase/lipase
MKTTGLPLLLVALALGCSEDDRKKRKPNLPPTASICIDRTSGPAPLTVTVDGGGSIDPEGKALGYDWYFGAGDTASGRQAVHTFVDPGTHDVTLVVTDRRGDTDSLIIAVDVGPPGPADPPVRPTCGPDAARYPHGGVTTRMYGAGETAFWIFEPDRPIPSTAPVTLFLHGWNAVDPDTYLAWIHHIVRRGHIVIYPVYQVVPDTPFADGTDNAIEGVRDAIVELGNPGHVTPDLDRVAAVGHSFGGMMTGNFAVRAAAEGLPPIQAIMPVEPGAFPSEWEDYASIPAGTLILSVAGEDDGLVGDVVALAIFNDSIAVSSEDKDYLLLRTDSHGFPALSSDHLAPLAQISGINVNAFDFHGFWRWWDALTDAAWYGTNREQALGDTPEQRYLGVWSDGTPVIEPLVTD